MDRWSVDLIRNRAQRLGTVFAKTEKEAIAIAIERFEVEPVRQNRITVSKISDKDDDRRHVGWTIDWNAFRPLGRDCRRRGLVRIRLIHPGGSSHILIHPKRAMAAGREKLSGL